ncbi:MAG: hypothetical protein M5U34_24270 [Chloroflexi bacterium]|nr:hypothetical protein [Chloroflexota bacterium]
MNVKYVITSETIDSARFALAWEGEGVRIYENLGVAPRAYTLPLSATAVVDDALIAMQELDPRQYVVIESQDWKLETKPIPNPQSPIPNPFTPPLSTITAAANSLLPRL